ncbi:MAG: zinc ribbon domain-containing protein [Bacilli bacterium]|nr:zinc ribbon domain-containing protein [Bacilli bacterium]
MNYCVKCGNKLNKNSKFCSKCGNQINANKIEKNTEIKKNKEEKKEKLLLSVGTLLIIVSSVIFAIANWNEMTSILKVLFLSIESLLFLSLSIFSKKLDYKMPYKFLWFLGISFIPIILYLVAKDKMLGEYLSFDGNGMYVYLAISSFICFILYFISDKFLKSNLFLYISYIFIYITVICLFGIFNLDKFEIMIPILNSFNLIICIFYSFIKNKNYNRTINIFISIVLLISSIVTCVYSTIKIDYILHSITYITIIASLLLLIFKSKRNILIYLYPFIINLILILSINSIFNKYINVILFMSILSIILFNFIINIKDNKLLKNISYILMLLFIMIILIIYNVSYITLCINSLILLFTCLFIIKLNDEKIQIYFSKTLLPTIIFLIIYTLCKNFLNIDISIIYLIISMILFTLFVIFNQKKKDPYSKGVFEIFSYTYLILSSLTILFNKPNVVAFILNEIIWLYYFVFNKAIKRNKALNIWLLIMLIMNFALLSIRYSVSFYYSLLFISLITLILDFIEIKINNKQTIYIYISIITSSLAVISNLDYLSLLGVSLTVLSYVFTYYLYNKKHRTVFPIKFFYTLIGFILINSIFNYFINLEILVNILVLASYLIILVSMFLLEVDSDRKVLSYSIVIAYPYLQLINSIDLLSKYSVSLKVLLTVILLLIYFEKVFKLKEKEKIIFELILLGLIHIITISDMLVFNIILSAFYIFYGFYKKRDSFTIFGTILLIITLFINIFSIANNIAVTYVLLTIGLIMLAYVFYIEAKKRKK